MSFQIEVLKVLSAHPGGRATIAAIKKDLVALASREWSQRVRELAKMAPTVDVFSSGFILRTPDTWQITPAGMEFLTRIEAGEQVFIQPHVLETPVEMPVEHPVEAAQSAELEDAHVIEILPDRPQRPLRQYRPESEPGRRTVMRRVRQLAARLIGR